MARFAKCLLIWAWSLSALSLIGWFGTLVRNTLGDDLRAYPVTRWYYPGLFASFPVWGGVSLIAGTILWARSYWRSAAVLAALPLIFLVLASEHFFFN